MLILLRQLLKHRTCLPHTWPASRLLMRRLKRFITGNSQERTLLVHAAFWVLAVRLGLCILPFRTLKNLTGTIGIAKKISYRVSQCVWAVRATSRCVPAATCLTQAL